MLKIWCLAGVSIPAKQLKAVQFVVVLCNLLRIPICGASCYYLSVHHYAPPALAIDKSECCHSSRVLAHLSIVVVAVFFVPISRVTTAVGFKIKVVLNVRNDFIKTILFVTAGVTWAEIREEIQFGHFLA